MYERLSVIAASVRDAKANMMRKMRKAKLASCITIFAQITVRSRRYCMYSGRTSLLSNSHIQFQQTFMCCLRCSDNHTHETQGTDLGGEC